MDCPSPSELRNGISVVTAIGLMGHGRWICCLSFGTVEPRGVSLLRRSIFGCGGRPAMGSCMGG